MLFISFPYRIQIERKGNGWQASDEKEIQCGRFYEHRSWGFVLNSSNVLLHVNVGVLRHDVDVLAIEAASLWLFGHVSRVNLPFKHHVSRFEGKKSMVLTQANVISRVELGTALAHQDMATFHKLSARLLQTQELRLRITTVFRFTSSSLRRKTLLSRFSARGRRNVALNAYFSSKSSLHQFQTTSRQGGSNNTENRSKRSRCTRHRADDGKQTQQKVRMRQNRATSTWGASLGTCEDRIDAKA